MIGPIVPLPQNVENQSAETPPFQPARQLSQRMDPLSEVLAMLKPQSLASGGFVVPGDIAIYFPTHQGVKCYAMLAGQCWLVVEGVPDPVLLRAVFHFGSPRISHSNRSTTRLHGTGSARAKVFRRFLKAHGTWQEASSRSRAAMLR